MRLRKWRKVRWIRGEKLKMVNKEKLKSTDPVVIAYMSGMTKKERLADHYRVKDIDGAILVNRALLDVKRGKK